MRIRLESDSYPSFYVNAVLYRNTDTYSCSVQKADTKLCHKGDSVLCRYFIGRLDIVLVEVSIASLYGCPYYYHTIYYLFNLNGDPDLQLVPRFAGFFLEPGHLGTMCVFLLCINRFRLREFGNKILLAGVLFSLSLAAYGLLVGAVIIYFIQMRKIIWIIIFGSLFATVGIISYFYNNGDNVLYQMIFHRIEFEDGEMVGNNRTSMYFDAEFDKYLSSSKVWTGMGRDAFGSEKNANQNITIGCAGYKRYFFIRGVLGTVLLLLFLVAYYWNYRSIWTLGFLIVFIVGNLIRDYPLKPIWLYLFILSLPILKLENK